LKSLLTARERRVVAMMALLVASGYVLLGLGFDKSNAPPCDLDSLDAVISLLGAAQWADSTQEKLIRGPVNINRASYGELLRLPGIGPSRAHAILELRQKMGRFRNREDLLEIHGIGPRTLQRLADQIELGTMCPDIADSMALIGRDK
jgi:competence ComEA-like helix-hairpin-helix protein